MRIRQSTLGAFDKCPRGMQYALETPQDVYYSGIIRAIGTAYHAALELGYKAIMDGQAWPSLDDQLAAARASLEHEVERAGEHFIWTDKYPDTISGYVVVRGMLENYQEHSWAHTDWEVLGVEWNFRLPFYGEHERSGQMDLVLRDPDSGWIFGVDHKTADKSWPDKKSTPRANNQGPFYTGVLKEVYPDAPGWGFVFDVMTYRGRFHRYVTYPTEQHVQLVTDKALSVIAMYTGMRSAGMDLPANPASNLCSPQYCDFYDICPHGRSAE